MRRLFWIFGSETKRFSNPLIDGGEILNSSSMTARRLPPVCRTTATCWPARSRTSCRATRPCAATTSTAASAGTATGCRSSTRWSRTSRSAARRDIEKLGVDVFNEQCRSIVLRYTAEWREIVTRMGRWVDFDRDYKTMDPAYMESIWWVFKSLWDKDLIYEGHKILPYCPRCATPLSNFETNQGYADVTDPAITVRFKLDGRGRTRTSWPGPRRPGRCRRTWPWPWARTSRTRACEDKDDGLLPGQGPRAGLLHGARTTTMSLTRAAGRGAGRDARTSRCSRTSRS